MAVMDVLEGIKTVFINEKNKGVQLVSIEGLISFIEAIKAHEQNNPGGSTDPAIYAARLNNENNSKLEMFKTVITYGKMTLNSAMLINGGAAVAILALMGNIWGKVSDPLSFHHLIKSASMFAFGVLTAAIAVGFSYLTQLLYTISISDLRYDKASKFVHGVTMIIAVIAFVFFGFGVYHANEAMAIHIIKR